MQEDLRGNGRCPVLKMLWWILVELPEIPKCSWTARTFEKAEDILRAEGVKVCTCGLP